MNSPSYSNPGGTGCRCSTPLGAGAGIAGTLSSPSGATATISVPYVTNSPFIITPTNGYPSDINNRTIGVTWSGGPTAPVPALITNVALTGGGTPAVLTVTSLPVANASVYPGTFSNHAWPTNGTAVNVLSGGRYLIGVTSSGLNAFTIGGFPIVSIESLFDGNVVGNPSVKAMFYSGSTSLDGSQYFQLDFGIQADPGVVNPLPVQKYFDEFRFLLIANGSQGLWKLQASNDPTFPATAATITLTVDGGATFNLGLVNIDVHTVTHPNAVNGVWPSGYRYFRFTGMTGTISSSGPYFGQLEFKIDDWGAVTPKAQPYPFTGNDLAISLAIEQAMSSGMRAGVDLPGIVYSDSFSEICGVTSPFNSAGDTSGWFSNATLTVEKYATFAGTAAMRMTGAGTSYIVERQLYAPTDFTGSTAFLRVAQVISNAVSKTFTISLFDINAHSAAFNLNAVFGSTAADVRSLWRLSTELATTVTDAYSGVTPSDPTFDITKIVKIRITYTGAANDQVVLKNITFAKNPSHPLLSLRLIVNQGNNINVNMESGCMFIDWVTTNYPQCPVSILSSCLFGLASATAGLPNQKGAFASLGSSGYGNLPAFYLLACQKYGHQMESCTGATLANSSLNTYPQSCPVYRDYPLSGYSIVGATLLERYWLEGCGFASQSTRLYSNDSWIDRNAIDYILPWFDSFIGGTNDANSGSAFAQSDGQLLCQFGAIGTLDAGATLIEENFIRSACINNFYYCTFAAVLVDINATSAWGAGAGHTTSSNVLGFGAGWDFDQVDRSGLFACMSFFKTYIVPALQGTSPGQTKAAKWTLPAALLNANVPAGGGGGLLRVGSVI